MKKIMLAYLAILAFPALTFAQQGNDPLADPLLPFYVVTGFVFIVALLVLGIAIYLLQILNMLIRMQEAARPEAAPATAKQQSLWQRFWIWINGYQPLEKESELLLDHNYDGIRELDNHLPPWWKWLLYGSVVWGAAYLIVYHVTDTFPLMDDEYKMEVAKAAEQKAKLAAAQPAEVIDENALVYQPDEAILASGKKIYAINCASCHMPEGQGSIGPNLTDDYWIHGGSIKDIYLTIKNGVPEKGMISWAPVLSPAQMRDVAFYIKSIRGTNPPNPKAPQGELYKEEGSNGSAEQGASM
ncbi:MAG: c-type cytochrome [Cyclobacteriaceae bacterium]|nr:c-type cytochrome [Cyclobacteriaceae bacterium]MDW8330187.1 cbb3-type cytochrome c oxidase N-terminal domain-containing protein [Cyclobacteriaceae bacterium]